MCAVFALAVLKSDYRDSRIRIIQICHTNALIRLTWITHCIVIFLSPMFSIDLTFISLLSIIRIGQGRC